LRSLNWLTMDLFRTRNKVVRTGVPPIRIKILTSISGVEFEAFFAERVMIRIEETVVDLALINGRE